MCDIQRASDSDNLEIEGFFTRGVLVILELWVRCPNSWKGNV